MSTPAGYDDELVGSTHPIVLGLALSGALAAAAGGENHVAQATAEAVVVTALAHPESGEILDLSTTDPDTEVQLAPEVVTNPPKNDLFGGKPKDDNEDD